MNDRDLCVGCVKGLLHDQVTALPVTNPAVNPQQHTRRTGEARGTMQAHTPPSASLPRRPAGFVYSVKPTRLASGPLVRRTCGVLAASPCFSHRTSDLGVLPVGSGLPASRPVVDALHSRALTLRSRTLTFVGTQLSFVSQLLAVIRDSVPLIGDAISFVSDPFASRGLNLMPRQGRRTVIRISAARIGLGLITDHGLTSAFAPDE